MDGCESAADQFRIDQSLIDEGIHEVSALLAKHTVSRRNDLLCPSTSRCTVDRRPERPYLRSAPSQADSFSRPAAPMS
jgi:hypothetical protein